MIKKSDFVWHIGFQGNTAVVNARQKKTFRQLESGLLLEASFLRAAFCCAFWESEIEQKPASMDAFLGKFKSVTQLDVKVDDLKRMMGVFQIPTGNLHIQQV